MAEVQTYSFDYQEVVEALVKKQGVHEGIWQLSFEFAFAAANVGPSNNDLKPSVVIPLVKVAISRTDKETNLSVDASKVNPP